MESMPINPAMSIPQLMGGTVPVLPSGKGKELEEACNDFIGVLFSYTFSQMRNTEDAEEGSLFGGDHAQMLLGFMDQEFGKKLARSEGSGLAKQLFWQLNGEKPLVNGDKPHAPQGKAT
ncbi:MAG: rod-binding protein [Candidatus Sericytochromatia bacterium]|nr:rod-binding protein [Candidatus Sericytochromatia bacterium]